MKQPRLKQSGQGVLLASLAAAFPVVAHAAPAARVDFAIGEVKAIAASGQVRTLSKGAQLDQGETIATRDGRAQLRFTDGAMVSLQPQSEFRIDQYRFEGKPDGSERGFFSLLKGGLRTITGAVGRTNRKNYKVSTAVATIGIRGTEFTIQYGGSITGSVGEGEIEVCNGAGCLNVTNGESYYVQNQDVRPVMTQKKTDLPPAPPPAPPVKFADGESVNSNGDPCVIYPASCVAPGVVNGTFSSRSIVAHSIFSGGNSHGGFSSVLTGTSIFSSGLLVSMPDAGGGTVTPGTTAVVQSGGDQFISFGRLANGVLGGTVVDPLNDHAGAGFSAGQSFYYLTGVTQPLTVGLTLASVSYSLFSAPNPTFTPLGPASVGTPAAGILNNLNFLVNLSGATSTGTFSMLLTDPSAQTISVTGAFGGSPGFISGGGTGFGACSGSGCNATISGFFAGANAETLGIAYEVDSVSFNCGINCGAVGVAVLKP
ncbi:MAG: FecR domain-containing protein [Burkholderiales bacterium]